MKIDIKNLTCQNQRIKLVPRESTSEIITTDDTIQIMYSNDNVALFCLGPADGCTVPPFDPNDVFGAPDSSCEYPLKDIIVEGNTQELNLVGLQNINTSLYLKNLNEFDTTVKIYKQEGPSYFKTSSAFLNNRTNRVSESVFQVCLRGNACLPGIIDFSGALIFDDEISGTITSHNLSQKDYFSTDQLISKLGGIDLEMIELFEWQEPEEELDIPCEDAINLAIISQNYAYGSHYISYKIRINDFSRDGLVGNDLSIVLDNFLEEAYDNGHSSIYQSIDYFADSSGTIYIHNLSSSEYFKISIKAIELSSGPSLPIPLTEWVLPSGQNENNSIFHDSETGELSFCLSPREPLSYIGFNGWFGEGWKGIHKYAIEVNGVLYEDPRTVETADGAWFIGSLSDVIDNNPDDLYMFGSYLGSDGGGQFYLNQPGRYNIRFIKQEPTGDYENYEEYNIPEYSDGEYPTIDSNGNWSFTLYLAPEQNEVILS